MKEDFINQYVKDIPKASFELSPDEYIRQAKVAPSAQLLAEGSYKGFDFVSYCYKGASRAAYIKISNSPAVIDLFKKTGMSYDIDQLDFQSGDFNYDYNSDLTIHGPSEITFADAILPAVKNDYEEALPEAISAKGLWIGWDYQHANSEDFNLTAEKIYEDIKGFCNECVRLDLNDEKLTSAFSKVVENNKIRAKELVESQFDEILSNLVDRIDDDNYFYLYNEDLIEGPTEVNSFKDALKETIKDRLQSGQALKQKSTSVEEAFDIFGMNGNSVNKDSLSLKQKGL